MKWVNLELTERGHQGPLLFFDFEMKNKLRKWLSIERRDLWDSPRQYLIFHLSVDKLKHMQRHAARKDVTMKRKLKEALKWRMYKRIE